MNNINKTYTDFHLFRAGVHCYPSEFLIRTMLGNYPQLKLQHDYNGKNVLDWACGDGRNLILLNNLGFKLHAFEITKEICESVQKRMERFGINADIKIGRNSKVPYGDNYFDYIVASASLYYVDYGEKFKDNLIELCRVARSGGYVILSLAHPQTFILDKAIELDDSHFKITNDPYNLRNGHVFKNEQHIMRELSPYFDEICIGSQKDDFYGEVVCLWLVVAKKK